MNTPNKFPESETAQLEELFLHRGASAEQATIMTGQLQKRSAQIAQERDISRIEAMQELLTLILKAQSEHDMPPPPS